MIRHNTKTTAALTPAIGIYGGVAVGVDDGIGVFVAHGLLDWVGVGGVSLGDGVASNFDKTVEFVSGENFGSWFG